MKIALLVVLIIAIIILGPLLCIWALNILFPSLLIEYTWQTWLACIVIGAVIGGSKR